MNLTPNNISRTLGTEYDTALQTRLRQTLAALGAQRLPENTSALCGSQEFYCTEFMLDGAIVRIECETYIGLTLTAPAALLAKIETALAQEDQSEKIQAA